MQKCKFLAYACFRGFTFEQKVVNNYLSLSLHKIWPNDQISAIYSNAVNGREVRLANTVLRIMCFLLAISEYFYYCDVLSLRNTLNYLE